MHTNDYHQKSIGKLVILPFTAKVQGKWWKYKSNKLCLHRLNIPSLDIIPVSEMIYFFTMNSIPWEGEAIKEVHYQTYIIKHQRWFSEVTLRYVRAIWEVWVYYIYILRITSSISTSSTSSQITSYINSYHFTQHWCKAYVDWISDYTSSTIHIHITLLQHIIHVQNLQRATQSALASPHKRSSIADMLLQACYTFCRSDWQHLDTTI